MAFMGVLMLVSQPVKDYDTWKARYDANHQMREDAGMVERFVGRDAKKPNVVHVGLVAPSLEAAKGYLANPALLDAMARAGVADAPEIHFVLLDEK
jgi:hypothetical protein